MTPFCPVAAGVKPLNRKPAPFSTDAIRLYKTVGIMQFETATAKIHEACALLSLPWIEHQLWRQIEPEMTRKYIGNLHLFQQMPSELTG